MSIVTKLRQNTRVVLTPPNSKVLVKRVGMPSRHIHICPMCGDPKAYIAFRHSQGMRSRIFCETSYMVLPLGVSAYP